MTRTLGGPRLFVKRDDATGLALGGNKVRKLEFLVGDARRQGSDVLITEGGAQSNHCRQTAAAAARCGLECVLVLSPGHTSEVTGNLLLDQLLGARVITVERSSARRPMMERVAHELREQGRRPYLIPTGGSNGIGATGYAGAVHELESQANASGVSFDAIVFCSGSGGTHGGLLAGAGLLHARAQLIGISDGASRSALAPLVVEIARDAARYMGAPLAFADEDVVLYEEYAREGYGVPNQGMIDAVRLVARTEGILLDPVYSGKAMAGLIDLVHKGVLGRDQTVCFIHTGGTPALFAYGECFV